jgi:post-segregation antitoxin (ccd killing protein)
LRVLSTVRTITVKVDEKLRKRMAQVTINWSRYIRESIRERIEREERKRAAQELLEDIRKRKHVAPRGFINQTIREARKAR